MPTTIERVRLPGAGHRADALTEVGGEGLGQRGHDGVGQTGGDAEEQCSAGPHGPHAEADRDDEEGTDDAHGEQPDCWCGAVVDVDTGCDHHHEDRQTDRHTGHRSPLRPGQSVVHEQAVDGKREDDRRHQDRLHHHQGAGGQRAEHEEEPDQVAADAEQPPGVAGQAGQQPEAHRHVGRGSGGAVLEGHASTEHRRRQHGEHERRAQIHRQQPTRPGPSAPRRNHDPGQQPLGDLSRAMDRQRRPTVRRRGGGPGCGVGRSDPARFACRALWPSAPTLRHHPPVVGAGHPQPHPGLVLRPGQLLRLRRLPRARPSCWWPRVPTSSTWAA